MEVIYHKHRDIIINLFQENDLRIILVEPLKSLFTSEAIKNIEENKCDRVKIFFQEFDKITLPAKFLSFIDVTTDVSEWIAALLISTDDGDDARRKYCVSYALINQYADFFIDNLRFNSSVLVECTTEGLITKQMSEFLIKILSIEGEDLAKNRFHSVLHIRSVDCYQKFLYLCSTHNPVYLELFSANLHQMIIDSSCEEEKKACIFIVSSSEIEDYSYDAHSDHVVPAYLESSSLESTVSAAKSPYDSEQVSDDDTAEADPDMDELFGIFEQQGLSDILNFQPEISPSETVSLEMRKYQNELAKKGVEGKNVLVCAPTSSGKTIVAIKITQEHLKSNGSGKVALVVPTTVLVDQQFNLFRKYLAKKWKINKLSGGLKSFSVPLSKQIKDYDIFVFTSDILRNSLEDKEEPLKSIGEFSLIIFDECHHCDKDHSYNKVMDHYFKNKQEDLKVPQIIGMTASTGTDKAKNVDAALKSLFSLCANLDCQIVSTVTINLEELNKNLPTPSSYIETPGGRVEDNFEASLLRLMDSTEKILHDTFSRRSKPIGIPGDRYHDKYLSFVKGITDFVPSILSEEERKGVKIIEIYLENLYRALIINHLFHCAHAIEMLKEKIERKAPCTCNVEEILRSQFNDFLSSSTLDQDNNPSLEFLKCAIANQMKEDRRSKIIIFVKEVLYTRILENEIEKAKIGFIECKALVGTNKSSDQGGLSKSETEEIMNRFRRGTINLIFATSVAEEGLDVERCNLIVRYGHVTNEISMVQSRGRARAHNSKYIVIVPQKLKWQVNKENINKVREDMMYQAIERFQRMDLSTVNRKLFECQEKRLALRTMCGSNNVVETAPKTDTNSDWVLHCIKCEHFLCGAVDIRLANGTSYIVINKSTYGNLKMKSGQQNNHQVVCAECQLVLGYVIKVDGIFVPTLKINQCILKSGLETLKRKKWKDSPFLVFPVMAIELTECQCDVYRYADT